jgi:hypothetical protein
MAGPVMIDIPGVGNVEAKNAATESTLRELVNIMKGFKGGGGGSGGGGSGGGGGGAGAAGKGGGAASQLFNAASKSASGGMNILGGATKGLIGGMKGLTSGVGMVASGASLVWKGFNSIAMSAVGLVNELANVGDSLTAAAASLKHIPIVGGLLAGVLGAVAAAAEATTGAFQQASQSGASFGGSVGEFASASSKAGMTMKDFAGVIQNNRDAMLAFGNTSESGAKNFANVSKSLRSSSSDLYALGFSTKDINEGLGKYGSLLRAQGLQGTKTNAELAQGAKSYMKELDLLAKATGQSRAEVEGRMAAMAKDAQFQAAMAGASDEVRKSFMAITTGMPKELETFTKDILANGTATTEENQKLLAMMPQSAAMMQQMNAKMQRGEAVTLEERQALTNLMKEEGGRNLKNIKQAGAASAELSGTVNALAATQTINANALTEGTKAQQEAAAKTDKLNEQVEKSKAKLAEFSNGFQMALANSGMLDVLMSAFEMLANFTMTYIVPAMNLMFAVIQKVWNGFNILLAPVIESVSNMLGGAGLQGTIEMIDSVMNAVFPVLDAVVRGAISAVEGMWNGIQQLFEPLNNLWNLFGELGGSTDTLTDIILIAGEMIGGVFEFLGAVIGTAINAVVDITHWFMDIVKKSEFLTNVFNTLKDAVVWSFTTMRKYLSAEGFKSLLELVTDGFMGMIDTILNLIPDALGGMSDEEKKKRDEERKARAEARDARLETVLEEKNQKLEANKEGIKHDTAKFQQQKLHMQKMGGIQKEEEDAKKKAADKAAEGDVVKNYNDPIALLKAEAKQQRSDIIPKSEIKNTASSGVSGASQALEAATEQQKQEAAKAKMEAEQKAKEAEEKKGSGGKKTPATTQDSAETLLASLNTKMDQLIKINRDTHTVNESQLRVQQGFSNDVFTTA